ncbi:MAG: heme lyase CcmF/NrfE family subunit [Azospirillaceae bacterium]|nr:heme lyase CcmF/NrfE family subunit [Azospirillaceae bacterium]
MIPELGHYALVLAAFVAMAQAFLPLAGAARGNSAWMAVARPAALAQFGLVAFSFGALMHAHIVSDFTVLNVVEYSHSLKPMLYKVAGVWGSHEGSMMLWVLILSLFGAAVAALGGGLPDTLRARVIGVQALIGVGFLLFILATSNPFVRVDPPPLDGHDLNPLLQDPGLAFHPPFLYLGYVGFSIVFSFAAAALIEGRIDPAWARWVRPWTLIAWSALTIGIAMGSWWAYYTLGWGGWWFWDPTENASFLPWLAGTALLHSAIVVEKRDALKSWTILLAILSFSLSLVGTFLVRSGVLSSVHAFAVDPSRGVFILVLLTIAIGGSLTLYAIRAPHLRMGGLFAPVSREGGLVINNLLLASGCGTVLLGTLYPLFLDALNAGKVSVGPPFFNSTFVPLMVPLVALLGVGPLLSWKRADLPGALGRLKVAALLTFVAVVATYWLHQGGPAMALVGIAMAAWACCGAVTEWVERVRLFRVPLADSMSRALHLPRSAWGMTIAHFGMGVAIAGMTGSVCWVSEHIQSIRPGDQFDIAGYSVSFDKVEPIEGPNYQGERGTFTARSAGKIVAVMHPEQRFYPVQRTPTTEAAIHTTALADLYVVMGTKNASGGYAARAYHHPLVPWLWLGTVLMAVGGVVSLSDLRYRVGVPVRHRLRRSATTAAAE